MATMLTLISSALLATLVSAQAPAAPAALDITLYLASERPAWAEKLSPNLAGFSIEMDRWPDWAGARVGQPNVYFNQLLHNLGERTGHMPFLRVGANSQDRATVDLSVEVMRSTFPEPTELVPNPEADHIFIGRDFYALSGNLPRGTPFHWGLNLKGLNKTETVRQARLLAETFQGARASTTEHVKLVNVEIGNEPDFYGPTMLSFRGPLLDWDQLNYTNTWVEYAKAISEVIDFGCSDPDKPTLSPGGFTSFNFPVWSADGVLQSGLLDDPDLKCRISQFAGHMYSGGFDPRRIVQPGDLMNKLTIRSNMTIRTTGRDAVRAAGLKFLLSEMNSYANHGQPGLSNTVESALWATDSMLLGATYGIERFHFHHGVGFRYNTLQPTDESDDGLNISHPHILPSYHAFLIVNEAIGNSGKSWVTEIPTSNLTLTAYAIWEEQTLARIVVLNTQVYLGQGEKPKTTVHLDGAYAGNATMKLLRSGKTTDHTGLTWAGQSFETLSGVPEGQVTQQDVVGGSFDLPASSIALLTLG